MPDDDERTWPCCRHCEHDEGEEPDAHPYPCADGCNDREEASHG